MASLLEQPLKEEAQTDELDGFCRDRYPKLVGFLSLYCRSSDVAEELAQEALARAIRDWHKVRIMGSPEAWLHRVALNLANSFFRRRAAEGRAKERLAAEPAASMAEVRPVDLAVRQAVAALPRREKTALLLRYFAGFSVRETAEILECPEGTVKTLTHRAITTLRGLPQIEALREVPNGG